MRIREPAGGWRGRNTSRRTAYSTPFPKEPNIDSTSNHSLTSTKGTNVLYHFDSTIPAADIDNVIQEHWSRLQNDPVLKAMAVDKGISLRQLPLGEPCPYVVSPEQEGFDIVVEFVVTVGATITAEYSIRALDLLWLHLFKPRLEQVFGANIQDRSAATTPLEKPDPGS